MRSTTMLMVLGMAGALAACGDNMPRKATVQGESGTKLTLSRPSSVTLRQGETAKVDIHCSRLNVPGEISIRFSDLPAGVDVVDSSSLLYGEDGTFTLRASDTASLVENSVAKVTASAPNGPSVTQTFDVSVRERETASGR
jgi:hypothetical protein